MRKTVGLYATSPPHQPFWGLGKSKGGHDSRTVFCERVEGHIRVQAAGGGPWQRGRLNRCVHIFKAVVRKLAAASCQVTWNAVRTDDHGAPLASLSAAQGRRFE